MNDARPMYVQVRSDEWERMKNELQELRGDKAQLEETVAVLQMNAKNRSAKNEKMSELREWTADEINEYDDARLELAEDGKIECTRVYIKADADEVISTIKAERDEYRYNLSCARNEIHNMQAPMREDIKTIAELKADYKEACDRLQTANLIKDEQKAKADKLFSCLKYLVMGDLIKDCPPKKVATEIVKEYENGLG